MTEHPAGDSVTPDAARSEPRPGRQAAWAGLLETLGPTARELASALRLERPIVFFDLETTGTSPSSDRIVQIAAVKLSPPGDLDLRCELVNPGVPIPPEAAEVHGFTDETVAGRPAFADIAARVAAFFEGCDLAGFNVARFDIPLLEAEFARAGVEFSADATRVFDSMRIFHERERRDLAAAVELYCGREIEGAHGAASDTLHTVEVLAGQLERYPDLAADIDELDRISSPDPSWFDREGKLAWRDDRLALNFGKHRDRSLDDLAAREPAYLKWILASEFSPTVKGAVAAALTESGRRG